MIFWEKWRGGSILGRDVGGKLWPGMFEMMLRQFALLQWTDGCTKVAGTCMNCVPDRVCMWVENEWIATNVRLNRATCVSLHRAIANLMPR